MLAASLGTVRSTGQIQRWPVASLDAQNCDAWGRARVARGRRMMQRKEKHSARCNGCAGGTATPHHRVDRVLTRRGAARARLLACYCGGADTAIRNPKIPAPAGQKWSFQIFRLDCMYWDIDRKSPFWNWLLNSGVLTMPRPRSALWRISTRIQTQSCVNEKCVFDPTWLRAGSENSCIWPDLGTPPCRIDARSCNRVEPGRVKYNRVTNPY